MRERRQQLISYNCNDFFKQSKMYKIFNVAQVETFGIQKASERERPTNRALCFQHGFVTKQSAA